MNPPASKGKQSGFQKSHPQKSTWGRQGGKTKQHGSTYKPKKDQGARKVLTRTFDYVNTSCANFKYNYEPYFIVNTGVCSKASPQGVDRLDEPDHLQSHVGWKASPVHYKLGENNTRPMGLASHWGIPARTGSTSLANQANASNKLLHRGGGNDLLRGQRITVQRCSDRDLTLPGKLCITNLPSGKKGGGTETGHKPEGSQHVRETRAFQNRGTPHSPQPHPTEDWMIKLDLKDE